MHKSMVESKAHTWHSIQHSSAGLSSRHSTLRGPFLQLLNAIGMSSASGSAATSLMQLPDLCRRTSKCIRRQETARHSTLAMRLLWLVAYCFGDLGSGQATLIGFRSWVVCNVPTPTLSHFHIKFTRREAPRPGWSAGSKVGEVARRACLACIPTPIWVRRTS